MRHTVPHWIGRCTFVALSLCVNAAAHSAAVPADAVLLDWIEATPENFSDAIHFPKDKRRVLILADELDLRDGTLNLSEYDGAEPRAAQDVTIVADRLILGDATFNARGSRSEGWSEERKGTDIAIVTREVVLDYGPAPYGLDLNFLELAGGQTLSAPGSPGPPGRFSLQYATARYGSRKEQAARTRIRKYFESLSPPVSSIDLALLETQFAFTLEQATQVATAAAAKNVEQLNAAVEAAMAPWRDLPPRAIQETFVVMAHHGDPGGELMNAARRASNLKLMNVMKLESGDVDTFAGLEAVPTLWLIHMYRKLSAQLGSLAPENSSQRQEILNRYAALPRYQISSTLLDDANSAEAFLRRQYRLTFPDKLAAGERFAWQMVDGTVQVEARFEGLPPANGYAFAIGMMSTSAGPRCCTFATADHLVRSLTPDGQSIRASSITVRRYGQGDELQATTIEPNQGFYGTLGVAKSDLAILYVEMPSSPAGAWGVKIGKEERTRPGDLVWYLGKSDGDWAMPSQPGSLTSTCDQQDCSLLVIKGLRTEPGNSGAPFTNQDGLIGMHLRMLDPGNQQSPSVYALRIDRIRALVEEYWPMQWMFR